MSELVTLALFIEADMLRLEVSNHSNTIQRFWQHDNSWGWEMPRVILETVSETTNKAVSGTVTESEIGVIKSPAQANSRNTLVLRPALRLWTRNMATTIDLQPGESTDYLLSSTDFLEDDLQRAQALKQQALLVSGELHSPSGSEQATYKVWSGRVTSNAVPCAPPHLWLQTPAALQGEDTL